MSKIRFCAFRTTSRAPGVEAHSHTNGSQRVPRTVVTLHIFRTRRVITSDFVLRELYRESIVRVGDRRPPTLSLLCLKSLRVLLSFTPGFSPVRKDRKNHRNRFNGFSVSFAGQVFRSQSRECLEKTSKPLKRFTNLVLCLSPG